jgi:catechol 2,3-dioxygenase-like lactoylglutathione lyase family enzyme
MIEINGVAHTFLTVKNFSQAREFYRQLLPFLGMTEVMDNEYSYYCVGDRTGAGLRPAENEGALSRFDQSHIGLHHLCFRARAKEDVDTLYEMLTGIEAKIVHPPQEDGFAPGYYSVLFEDPEGIRLELNFVPGKGLLDVQ